ncbi:MAG: hypothetical protein J6Y62_01735 [Clostridia bacterium]|nr:hypothetical protein [Clostridia bacterium]
METTDKDLRIAALDWWHNFHIGFTVLHGNKMQSDKAKLMLHDDPLFNLRFDHVKKTIDPEYVTLGWSRSFIQVSLCEFSDTEKKRYCFGNIDWKDTYEIGKLERFWEGVKETLFNMIDQDRKLKEMGFYDNIPFLGYSCHLSTGDFLTVKRTDPHFNEVAAEVVSMEGKSVGFKKMTRTDRDGTQMTEVFKDLFEIIEDASLGKYRRVDLFAAMPEKMRHWMVEHA